MASNADKSRAVHIVTDVAVGLVGLAAVEAIGVLIFGLVVVYVAGATTLDPGKNLSGETDHDPAWPNYFRAQHQVDIETLAKVMRSAYRAAGKRWFATFPFMIVSWPLMAVAAVFDIVLYLVFSVAQLIVRLIGDVLYWLGAAAVRTADGIYARRKHAEASCPVCYEIMDRPAYKCPGCGKLHRDIRSGKRGAAFRACACGHRLPTGVLRAAWRLDALCQSCSAQMHRGAAVLQDVRVPVVGERHSGKTRLILAGFNDIVRQAKNNGIDVSFPDKSSKDRAEEGLELIAKNERTIRTDWQLDRALSCQIGTGTKGALLHAFDAAGERFRGSDGHDELRYLDESHTLIFVVDPFAVGGIRSTLGSRPTNDILDEHLPAQVRNPEDSYGEVVSRVQSSGTATKKKRLAIVVTKADILEQFGVDVPLDSETIKDWLYDQGLHNVVLAAEREFKEVRYFAVASVGGEPATPEHGAANPFIWAMTSRGFSLLTLPVKPKVATS